MSEAHQARRASAPESALRTLIRSLSTKAALSRECPFEPVLEVVLEHYRHASTRFSDTLEFSAQASAAHTSFARFSYAFPGFRDDMAGTERALARMAEELGIGPAAAQVMRAARHPIVVQPLLGLAMDDAHTARPKLYLQFRPGGPAKKLAASLLSVEESALPEGELHLLGLDFTTGGTLRGAKLYLHTESAPANIPPDLAKDALHIVRLERPGSPLVFEAFDFALSSTRDWHALQQALPAFQRFSALEAELGVRVRRASIGTGERTTLYYVLR